MLVIAFVSRNEQMHLIKICISMTEKNTQKTGIYLLSWLYYWKPFSFVIWKMFPKCLLIQLLLKIIVVIIVINIINHFCILAHPAVTWVFVKNQNWKNYTKTSKRNKKKCSKGTLPSSLCKLSNFARVLSNMYFLNFIWKLWFDIAHISCLILIGRFFNISFASSINSNYDVMFLTTIITEFCLDSPVGFFNTSCRCLGMFSLIKPFCTSFSILILLCLGRVLNRILE